MTKNDEIEGKPDYLEIEVVRGDSLWKIARRHLGESSSNRVIANYVNEIVRINKIENPDLIYPGEKFKLPDRKSESD